MIKYTHRPLDTAVMSSLVQVGHLEFPKSTPDVLLVTFLSYYLQVPWDIIFCGSSFSPSMYPV